MCCFKKRLSFLFVFSTIMNADHECSESLQKISNGHDIHSMLQRYNSHLQLTPPFILFAYTDGLSFIVPFNFVKRATSLPVLVLQENCFYFPFTSIYVYATHRIHSNFMSFDHFLFLCYYFLYGSFDNN